MRLLKESVALCAIMISAASASAYEAGKATAGDGNHNVAIGDRWTKIHDSSEWATR